MSRGSPSLVALLGLLAIGGYQNRAKLAEMMNGRPGDPDGTGTGEPGGGLMGQLGQMLGGGSGAAGAAGASGGTLSGLSEMMERFTGSHQGEKAQSWIGTGPNAPLAPADLEQVLDEDTLAELTQKTGLSRTELLTRLSDVLPEAVDKATPEGRLPTIDGARGAY